MGEAEKQLRVLFEEARRQQPSVIFFDEMDGLAPVRSSKQDQIHASIVSTLLALMDGLDSRGQVSESESCWCLFFLGIFSVCFVYTLALFSHSYEHLFSSLYFPLPRGNSFTSSFLFIRSSWWAQPTVRTRSTRLYEGPGDSTASSSSNCRLARREKVMTCW